MSQDVLKGKWKELKGKIRSQWADLTDDDVESVKGRTEELIGTLQKKYGYSKERAKKEIDDFLEKHK